MTEFFDAHPVTRWALSALFAASAIYSLARILTGPRASAGGGPVTGFYSDRDSDYAHLFMSAAMLGMLAVTAVPHAAWRIVFSALAIGYLAQLIRQLRQRRSGSDPTARAAVLGYHLFAALAMLYATFEHDIQHGGHHQMTASPPSAATRALIITLVAVFVLDALAGVIAVAVPRSPAGSSPLRSTRVAVLPHLVMDLGMSVMLLAPLLR